MLLLVELLIDFVVVSLFVAVLVLVVVVVIVWGSSTIDQTIVRDVVCDFVHIVVRGRSSVVVRSPRRIVVVRGTRCTA